MPSTGTGGGNAQPVDFLVTDVTGGDPTPYAQKVLDALKSVKGATSVNSSGAALTPEISIIFNRAKAQALGVDVGQAARPQAQRSAATSRRNSKRRRASSKCK